LLPSQNITWDPEAERAVTTIFEAGTKDQPTPSDTHPKGEPGEFEILRACIVSWAPRRPLCPNNSSPAAKAVVLNGKNLCTLNVVYNIDDQRTSFFTK